MAYYPILHHKGPAATTAGRQLPIDYMHDFSIVGLRVSDCNHAVRILDQHAFAVRHAAGTTEVCIDTALQMEAVVQLLVDNGLKCEVGDIAEGFYQG